MTPKLWLTGDWAAPTDLRAGLPAREGVDGVGGSQADVAVHVTAGVALADELARLREHSQVPVVLLAPAAAEHLRGGAAAQFLILPQPADAVVFAAHKAAAGARPRAGGRARITTVFSP